LYNSPRDYKPARNDQYLCPKDLILSLQSVKKLFVIFLTLVYSLSSMGIGLREFYCCGKLKSVHITLSQQETAKCGKGDENSGCCKVKHQFFKVKDKHLLSDYEFTASKHFSQLITPALPLEANSFYTPEFKTSHNIHAPPLEKGIPIFILNCVYRI
jgi:hypothetical protein